MFNLVRVLSFLLLAQIPRTADGKPDLNGIWQTLNRAAWDIQDHSGQLGVPPGQGVVEGTALVIDVKNFNDQTWFDQAGNFHSDALHVVERYTLADSGHILYEATIEDPKVFTRPWKISMSLYRRADKNVKLLEYECVFY